MPAVRTEALRWSKKLSSTQFLCAGCFFSICQNVKSGKRKSERTASGRTNNLKLTQTNTDGHKRDGSAFLDLDATSSFVFVRSIQFASVPIKR